MIKFSKICLHQNSIFETFENPRNFFYKIREIVVFVLLTRRNIMLFVNNENPHVFYFEEKMFANKIKDGREA